MGAASGPVSMLYCVSQLTPSLAPKLKLGTPFQSVSPGSSGAALLPAAALATGDGRLMTPKPMTATTNTNAARNRTLMCACFPICPIIPSLRTMLICESTQANSGQLADLSHPIIPCWGSSYLLPHLPRQSLRQALSGHIPLHKVGYLSNIHYLLRLNASASPFWATHTHALVRATSPQS